MCWEEMRKRWRKAKVSSRWEEGGCKFFEERSLKIEEIERKREEGGEWSRKLVREGREKNKRERWERIRESKYNRWYKEVRGRKFQVI